MEYLLYILLIMYFYVISAIKYTINNIFPVCITYYMIFAIYTFELI